MIGKDQVEGKAEMFIDFEDRLTLFDTLVLCRFYRDLYTWDELGEIIHNLTGIATDKESLKKIAATISNTVRRFNLREGMTPQDEWLPKGLFRKMEKTDNAITPEELDYMLKDYFRLRGWGEDGSLQ